MKTKLSNKEIALSVLTFIICVIALSAVMLSLLQLNFDGNLFEYVKKEPKYFVNILTVVISVCVLAMITYCYFYFENNQFLAKKSKIIELYLMMTLAFVICFFVGKYVDSAARPLLFMALLSAMLFRRRDAMFVNTVFAFTMFIYNRYLNSTGALGVLADGGVTLIESITSLLTLFCGGLIGIMLLKSVKTRLGSVTIAFVLLIPTIIINLVLRLPSEEHRTWGFILKLLGWSAFDCALSVLLFMAFLPVFEAMFSELTPFRLRELTGENAKLIKRLRTAAPGTYNHSIVVAQLAEACASAIGEDSELARAAAYYHDIGKLKNPEMFTENQSEYDMHKELTPELSVDIIRSHARDGAQLIKKNHLPEFFADVAIQHHGTLPIKYFYAKALKMSDGELNAANYSYPGPTPTTKIAAIIMIADASEAAARSLIERTPEKVEALVSSLVEERMNMDQFVDCDITMRELTIITRTLVNGLTGVYHSRIKYPKLVLGKKK